MVFYLMMSQKKLVHFNLPQNYKRCILFEQFPYLSHVKNLTLNKIVKNGIVDDVQLQKYLLATGLLQDGIQQSLDMVVIDGFFNNAPVRRELDQKYPTLMKKPDPVNVVSKDKAHFDPIIGSLAAPLSNNEEAIFEQIKKDQQERSERSAKLKRFNNKNNNDDDDNDDDDGGGDLPCLLTPPLFPLKNNEFDSEFDSDDKKLAPTQKFLLDKPQKRKASHCSRQKSSCRCTTTRKNNSKKG